MKKTILIAIIVLAVVVLLWLSLRVSYEKTFLSNYLNVIKVGQTKNEVLNKLGKPEKLLDKSYNGTDYYIKGYAKKKRQIEDEVFIYSDGEAVCYIYFIKDTVVDVFIGGS